MNVAAIRKALSDGEEGQSYIETVPRRGYRFIGDVQQAGKASEGGAAATEPTQQKSLLLPLGLERSSPQQGKSRSSMWSPRMSASCGLSHRWVRASLWAQRCCVEGFETMVTLSQPGGLCLQNRPRCRIRRQF